MTVVQHRNATPLVGGMAIVWRPRAAMVILMLVGSMPRDWSWPCSASGWRAAVGFLDDRRKGPAAYAWRFMRWRPRGRLPGLVAA